MYFSSSHLSTFLVGTTTIIALTPNILCSAALRGSKIDPNTNNVLEAVEWTSDGWQHDGWQHDDGSYHYPAPTTHTHTKTRCGSTCIAKRSIPETCEVDILVDLLDAEFGRDHKLIGQLLRASYHDAGTFDRREMVGGANGCLMNDPDMIDDAMGENKGLQGPIDILREIKNQWNEHSQTCIEVSSADIIQFSAFFAVVRQMGDPRLGITETKRAMLRGDITTPGGTEFKWGRPDLDVHECEEGWTENLPFFSPAVNTRRDTKCAGRSPDDAPECRKDFPNRCLAAGREIKDKMMDGQGFTKGGRVWKPILFHVCACI